MVQAGKLRGTADRPVIVAAAGDCPVVLDGTVAIEGRGKLIQIMGTMWSRAQTAATSCNFDADQQMLVIERYPSAGWEDRSMFMAVSNCFRSKAPGMHNLTSKEGLLRDNGACSSTFVDG